MATSDAPLSVPNVTLAVARANAPFTLLVDKDFEGGTVGQSAQSEFNSGAAQNVYADSVTAYEGSQYINTTAKAGNNNTFNFGGFLTISPALVVGDEVWVRQAIYATDRFWEDSSPFLKFMRLRENNSDDSNAGYSDIYISAAPVGDPGAGIHFIKEAVSGTYTPAHGPGITPELNAWTTYEMYLKLGNTPSTGYVRVWRNNVLLIDTAIQNMINSDGYCPSFLLFTYWNNSPAGPTVDHTVGVDSIQIATSASPPTNTDAAGNLFIGGIAA